MLRLRVGTYKNKSSIKTQICNYVEPHPHIQAGIFRITGEENILYQKIL